MATIEMPDEDLALLQRLLSSLSSNLNSEEMLNLTAKLWVGYLSVFVYETISAGLTPDGRPASQALAEDVRRLRELLTVHG